MKKLQTIWLILLIGGIIMVILSKWVFAIWIGDNVYVPYTLSIIVCVWVLINAFNSIYNHFLNGIGIVNTQVILSVGGAIFNIPLAIYLGKSIGIEGVLAANVLTALPGIIIYPIYYRKIMQHKTGAIQNNYQQI